MSINEPCKCCNWNILTPVGPKLKHFGKSKPAHLQSHPTLHKMDFYRMSYTVLHDSSELGKTGSYLSCQF